MELAVLLSNNDNSCFHKRGNLFCIVTQVWRGRLQIVMFKSFVCRQLNGTLTLPLEFMQKNSIFNSKLKRETKKKFIFFKLGIFIKNKSGWHSYSGIYAKSWKRILLQRGMWNLPTKELLRDLHRIHDGFGLQNKILLELISSKHSLLISLFIKSKIRMEISMLLIIIVCNNNNGKLQTATGHLFQLLSLA